MTYRIGGQVVDQGTGVSGQPVFVVDTGDADPSNWTVEAATTTNADGSWSVVVSSGNVERYHAVTQFEDGSTLKNAESKPFVTGKPVVRPVEIPIQFEIPSPAISAGTAIPDSEVYRSPIHRWPLNDVNGTVDDIVGGADGANNGIASVSGEYIGGAAGQGDGDGSYISLPPLSALENTALDGWSIAFVIDEAANVGTNETILFGRDSFDVQMGVRESNDGGLEVVIRDDNNGGTFNYLFPNTDIFDGNKHSVVIAVDYNADDYAAFVDTAKVPGSIEADQGLSGFSSTTAWGMFARDDGVLTLPAVLDEMIVSDQRWSQSDAQDYHDKQPWT